MLVVNLGYLFFVVLKVYIVLSISDLFVNK